MTPEGDVVTVAKDERPEEQPPEGTENPEPAPAVEEPKPEEPALNDVTQASAIAAKTGPVFDEESGLIKCSLEELTDTIGTVFGDKCCHEQDLINGFECDCLPLEVDCNGDLFKTLVCNLYGNLCKVYGDGDGVTVCDFKDNPLYFSDPLKIFLSNLCAKYLK